MEKTKKKKYFFQVLLINIKLEELRPPARTSRAPSTLPVPRSWITQNFNPPPPSSVLHQEGYTILRALLCLFLNMIS